MKTKEPSLLRQLIAIHYEQAKRRKALRELEKASWSYDFLVDVVKKAANDINKGITIELEKSNGDKIRITSVSESTMQFAVDDDIFNQLDNQAAVNAFIMKHQRRPK